MFERDPLQAAREHLRKAKYDVIGLSVRNIDNNDMHATAFYIKDLFSLVATVREHSDAPLILGGAALSVMPEAILRTSGISCAVIGDGETTFPLVIKRIERGEPYDDLPGVAFLKGDIFKANPPLPGLPSRCTVPDYNRWVNLKAYRSQLSTAPLQTKLGCQFQCVYCTYRKIEGAPYRLFKPEGVADAAKQLTVSGLQDIEFVDNVFNAPYDHAINLCETLIRRKVRARFQSVELNPACFTDELVSAMERAGFVGMGITVESASDPVLHGLRKGFTEREVYQAADTVRRHSMPCVWIFMLGGPGETRETVKETLRFAQNKIRPSDAAFFNIGIRVYPGTQLELIARKQGVLNIPAEEMLSPVFYISPDVDASWIRTKVRHALNSHMNYMSVDSFSFPHLPTVNRIAYGLGLRSPLWRYTRFIRRGLRLIGMNA
jgi:radical SAM superfamily enzyme YgiQ (UPF0313 family)